MGVLPPIHDPLVIAGDVRVRLDVLVASIGQRAALGLTVGVLAL
jgi:hypothetical protein